MTSLATKSEAIPSTFRGTGGLASLTLSSDELETSGIAGDSTGGV